MTNETILEKWSKRLGIICVVLVSIGLVVGIYGLTAYDMRWDKGMESFGNYASGTVVAFWSLAGVILIFIAFLQQKLELLNQKEELKLNRQELEETRKVLNQQRKEFELQNKTLLKQNFENLFFQMLRNYFDIVHHLDIGQKPYEHIGRDSFQEFYRLFKAKYGEHKNQTIEIARIDISYQTFINNYQSDLGNYFRNLYNLFKFIDKSGIEDKKMYTNIVRAQLSTYELGLLFYNCLSSYGRFKFKPLIEKYNLVKNFPKDKLINPDHASLYEGISFEEDERSS